MNKVTINGEAFFVNDGEILSDVLIKSEKNIDHPCGGMGKCKKCTVKVNGKEELSCQYVIKSDICVEFDDTKEIISGINESNNETDSENLCFVLANVIPKGKKIP